MDFNVISSQIKDFGRNHPTYWGCALAGETGEACNLIKKHERDGKEIRAELAEELADVFIYLVLIARRFDIDFQWSIVNKINEVEQRRQT